MLLDTPRAAVVSSQDVTRQRGACHEGFRGGGACRRTDGGTDVHGGERGRGVRPPEPAAAAGHVAIVQAVPGATVDVMIDGEAVESGVASGEVLGPYADVGGRAPRGLLGGGRRSGRHRGGHGRLQPGRRAPPAGVGGRRGAGDDVPGPGGAHRPGQGPRAGGAHGDRGAGRHPGRRPGRLRERRQRRVRDRRRPRGRARGRAVPDRRDDRPDPRAAHRRPGAEQPHDGLRRGRPGDRHHGPGRALGATSPPTARSSPRRSTPGQPASRPTSGSSPSDARRPEECARTMVGKRVRRRTGSRRRPGARRDVRRRRSAGVGAGPARSPTRRPKAARSTSPAGPSSRRRPHRLRPRPHPPPLRAGPARRRRPRPRSGCRAAPPSA